MSTKRLSRTVLEKGRRNTWERRLTTKTEKAKIRQYLHRITLDPEAYYEEIEPIRKPESPEFTDKLSPVYRFIDSQVGNDWADVLRLIKEKFDTRTLAGWHIVSAHILNQIEGAGTQERIFYYYCYPYYIDKNNILRKTKKVNRNLNKKLDVELYFKIVNWCEKRQPRMIDGLLYWFRSHHEKNIYVYYDKFGKLHWSYKPNYIYGLNNIDFYPAEKFDKYDLEFFFSLSGEIQMNILNSSKVNYIYYY